MTSFSGPLDGSYTFQVSSETMRAIEVTNCGAGNGTYVYEGEVLNGRPRFKNLDLPWYIEYDSLQDGGLGLWVVRIEGQDQPYLKALLGTNFPPRDSLLPPSGSPTYWSIPCNISHVTTPVQILDGNITSTVEEAGIAGGFTSTVRDIITPPGVKEVQVIGLSAPYESLDGTFEVDFEDSGGFTAAWDISAEDMEVLMEALPSVGDISVSRGPAPHGAAFGFSWTITFETQLGDLEDLFVDGNSTAIPISGVDAQLTVTEVTAGSLPALSLDVTDLEPGETFHARISASNEMGYGYSTLTDGGGRGVNNDGLGMAPLAVVALSAPAAPIIDDITPVSASQLEVTLSVGSALTANPLKYKVEWTTNSDFGANETKRVTLTSDMSSDDTDGRFRLRFGGEATYPLPHDASAIQLEHALESLVTVADVEVTSAIMPQSSTGNISYWNNATVVSGTSWDVMFMGSTGPQPKAGFLCLACVSAITNNTNSSMSWAPLLVNITQDLTTVLSVGDRLGIEPFHSNATSYNLTCMVSAEYVQSDVVLFSELPGSECSPVGEPGYLALHFLDQGGLLVESVDLRSVSGDGNINIFIEELVTGTYPDVYGYTELSTDTSNCGAAKLGPSSRVQRLVLSAGSTVSPPVPVTSGSYRLALGEHLTACVPYNATASELSAAIKELPNVAGGVSVYGRLFVDNGTYYPVPDEQEVTDGLGYDYLIRFNGEYPSRSGEWPLLRVPPEYFGQATGSHLDCETFESTEGDADPTAEVIMLGQALSCAAGSPATQVLLAEATSELGGSFSLPTENNSVLTVPLSSTAAELQTILEEAMEVSVTVTEARLGSYSKAWIVEFQPGSNKAGRLAPCDRFTTGTSASVHAYDVIQITTSVQNSGGLAGHFRFTLGGEVSDLVSHDASNGRVEHVLQAMVGVGKVTALSPARPGGSGGVDMPNVVLANQSSVAKATGDWTKTLSPGDIISFADVEEQFFSIFSLTYNNVTGLSALSLNRTVTGLNSSELTTSAVAGVAAISRAELPGRVWLSSPVSVLYSYPNVDGAANIVELTEGGVAALNLTLNSTVIIGGQEYEVVDIDEDMIHLERPFEGPTVTAGDSDLKVFVEEMDVFFTRDITNSVSTGNVIWVENSDGDVDELKILDLYAYNGSSLLSGTFTSDYDGAKAYTTANGRSWILALKHTDLNLETFQVETEADWRGIGARVEVQRPRGVKPLTATIGSPSEVQTVALRSFRPWWSEVNAAYNLTWALRLWPDESATVDLEWGASAASVQAALEDLAGVMHVEVERSGDGSSAEWFYGYVYTLSFWGVHKSSGLPQVTVEDSLQGVTPYTSTVRQGAAVASQTPTFVALKEGTTYSLRARALGLRGYGPASPVFVAETPLIGEIPSAPTAVTLGACRYTATSLGLEWKPPTNDGGQSVDGYRIEWDRSASFSEASAAYGTGYLQVKHEVQEVLVNFRSGDSVSSRGGTFTLAWGGRKTADLPWDSSASAIETAILGISGAQEIAINPISATRVPYRNGYRWTVTFMAWRGDLATLDGDGTLLVGDDPSVTVREKVVGSADIYPGDFTYEVQAVTVSSLSTVSGTFTLSFEGKEIEGVRYDEKAESFKAKIEAVDSIFCADVKRILIDDNLLLYSWHISFAWLNDQIVPGAGNLGLFTIEDTSAMDGNGVDVTVHELIRGTNPLEYTITALSPGVEYHARVAAHNSRGYGTFSSVVMGIPKDQPDKPTNATLAVSDASSLLVGWSSTSSDGGSEVTGYLVDWFNTSESGTDEIQMITTSAKKGVSEVQTVSITADADNIGGYYTLSMEGYTTGNIAWNAPATGTDSIKEKLERLPSVGAAEVSQDYSMRAVPGLLVDVAVGSSNATSSNTSSILPSQSGLAANDIIFLAGYRARVLGFSADGETLFFGSIDDYTLLDTFDEEFGAEGVVVKKWAYGYEYRVTFVSYNGDAPLMEAAPSDGWAGTNPVIDITEETAGLQPISGTFRLRFGIDSTSPLSHDASADEVEMALERLVDVGDVTVSKVVNGYGHNWIVTFVSEMGDVDPIEADGSGLTGPSAAVSVSVGQDGVLPSQYGYEEITDASTRTYEIEGLTLGHLYTVRVRVRNAEGYGAATATVPASLRPLEAPGAPEDVSLIVMSDTMLKLVWSAPASNGGNPVNMYRIDWDIDADFANLPTSGFYHMYAVTEEEGPYFYNIVVPAASSWLPRYARITAYNSYQWGPVAYPDPKSGTPVQRPPGEPQQPVLSVTSGVGLLLEWEEPSTALTVYGGDGGSSIEEYLVEWDTSAKFDSPARQAVVQMPGDLSYLIGGRDLMTGEESSELEPGVKYYTRISAFNAQGYGAVVGTSPASATTEDQVPQAPEMLGSETASSTSVTGLLGVPARDGGETLTKYRLEWDVSSDFSHINGSSRTGGWEDVPLVQEVQSFAVASSVGQEEQWIVASTEVTNERQTVRTQVEGVDEVQMVVTSADTVSPHIQTVTTIASDFDEVQEIVLDADDVDEWQYAYTDIGTVYETQVLTVSATRVNEVQQFVVTFTGNTTDGGEKMLSDAETNTAVSLTFDSSSMNWACVGASLTTSDVIAFNSSDFLMTPLSELSNIDNVTVTHELVVTNEDDYPLGTLEVIYNITFDGNCVRGNIPTGDLSYSCVTSQTTQLDAVGCSLTSIIEGNEPEGSFYLTYFCEASVNSTYVNATSSSNVVLLNETVGEVQDGDTFRINTISGETSLLTEWEYFTVESVSGNIVTLDSTFASPTGEYYAEYGVFFSGPGESYGVSTNCLQADPDFTNNPLDHDVSAASLQDELQGLAQLNSSAGCLEVVREAIAAETFIDFGLGAVEVIGYQYNITFYCANGNVPTLRCNTTGTSPFTSTNADMNDLTPPEGRQCDVTMEVDGSFIGGSFALSISYPHEKEGDALWHENYTTGSLSWRSTATEVEAALESVRDSDGTQVFGSVSVDRHVYWPNGVYKWSGQYNWSVTFETRPGDVPTIRGNDSLTSNTEDAVMISVGTARDGNEIGGSFGLTFCPNDGACTTTSATYFSSYITEDELKFRFSQAFFTESSAVVNVTLNSSEILFWYTENSSLIEVSDWLLVNGEYYTVNGVEEDSTPVGADHLVTVDVGVTSQTGRYDAYFGLTAVSVTRTGPTQAMGYSWEVTFSNQTVGGDQPDIVSTSNNLTGSGVDVSIDEIQQGNQLTGTFTLSYNGEPTSEIPFDASAASVQSALNSLSSIYPSRVDVTRSEEAVDRRQQVGGYTWTIVFDSSVWHDPTDHSASESYIDGNWAGSAADWPDTWESTGQGRFSKAWGKNVGFLLDIDCSSDGLGTTRGDGSEDCKVTTTQDGKNPLGGSFTLTLDTRGHPVMAADTVCTTGSIAHNAWATATESDGDGTSVEEILEATDCVGDVEVSRLEPNLGGNNGGYAWLITFLRDADSPCQQKDNNDNLCNAPGDVPKFNSSLTDTSELLGTSTRNVIYGDGDSSHGTVTILDNSDNSTKPPGVPEVQVIRVYDLALSASNKFETDPGFLLSLGGNRSTCVKWNTTADVLASLLYATSPIYAKDVVVTRSTPPVEEIWSLPSTSTPNGYSWTIHYIGFDGDVPDPGEEGGLYFNSSTNSTSCPPLTGWQRIDAETISNGTDSPISCSSEGCVDGVVLRGNFTDFHILDDGNCTNQTPVTWNAAAEEVEVAIESCSNDTRQARTRYVIDQYGTMEWVVTFTQNPGETPPGAGDVSSLTVAQDLSGVEDFTSEPIVTETMAGSTSLSGTFNLDYGDPGGSR
ncbi:unnamed protein product [Discosporangium mesarthrocarpum]